MPLRPSTEFPFVHFTSRRSIPVVPSRKTPLFVFRSFNIPVKSINGTAWANVNAGHTQRCRSTVVWMTGVMEGTKALAAEEEEEEAG